MRLLRLAPGGLGFLSFDLGAALLFMERLSTPERFS